MKKKVLAWCSSPTAATGFGRQANLILDSLFKTDEYDFTIIGKDYHGEQHDLPYNILPIFNKNELNRVGAEFQDILKANHTKCSGIEIVKQALMSGQFDILFVYQDMYLTSPLGQWLNIIRQELAKRNLKDFKIVCYYTVDGKAYPEYLNLAAEADVVVTPNKYGADRIREHLNRDIKIIPHGIEGIFKKLNSLDRVNFRKQYFGDHAKNFIVGFVGSALNPRKNVIDALTGFKEFLVHRPDAKFYLHSFLDTGTQRCIQELDLGGYIIRPPQFNSRMGLPLAIYKNVIASLDVLLNTSYSEAWGLPITEAMASGVPVVMPENIAMSAEYKDFSWQVKSSNREIAFDSTALYKGLDTVDMAEKLKEASVGPKTEVAIKYVGENYSKDAVRGQWSRAFEAVNINRVQDKENILFAQYESAGDVLLITRAFKGLKEKHPGKQLHVMTQRRYMDILQGNPHIDKLIPWDGTLIQYYSTVYKPHIDKIRTGGWGTGDKSLPNLYPALCDVEADKAYIECVDPGTELPKEYVVIHNTGGHPYRIYPHFNEAIRGIDIPFAQVGGQNDPGIAGAIDLRGKLTFRQTAWVIKHSKLFVGVDSFPHHCASALDVPQVAIFSSASPRTTASRIELGVIYVPDWLKNCPNISPCHGNYRDCQNPCINSIKAEDINKSIREILKKTGWEEKKDGKEADSGRA